MPQYYEKICPILVMVVDTVKAISGMDGFKLENQLEQSNANLIDLIIDGACPGRSKR